MSEKHVIRPSAITQFSRCGEQYRRAQIEKEYIPPGIAAIKGTSVHRGAEKNFSQKITSKIDLPKKEIIQTSVGAFEDIVKFEGVNLSEEEKSKGKVKVMDEGRKGVEVFASLYVDKVAPRWNPIFVEEKRSVDIPGTDAVLSGSVDVIDARNIVGDIKTSNKSKNQGEVDSSPQFTAYALLHKAVTGKLPEAIFVESLVSTKVPKAETLVTYRRLDDFESLLIIINQITKAVAHGVFPYSYGQAGAWWCSPRFCGYWSTCLAVPKYRRGEK